MDLCEAKKGSKIKIIKIDGGFGIVKRLAELGLFEGSQITVERNSIGPIVVNILNSKIAIGRGQAKKIEIEVI